MNLVCPVCASEYLGWVSRCSTCGVALVAPGEAPNPLELPEEDTVVYELGAWPLDQQAEAAAAMAQSGIPHAFDGDDLVVHVDHEPEVDTLLEAIEAEHGPFDAPSGDEEGEIVYELDGWSEEHCEALEARLQGGGVPYRFEDGTLVVEARDEAAVDHLVAEVRGAAPALQTLEDGEVVADTELAGGDGDADDDAGMDGGELVSGLFDVAARLERRPDDRDALVDFAGLNGEIDPERPPFGVDALAWERVIVAADDLADALTGEGGPEPDDPEAGDAAVVVLAARNLRAALRPYV
jgi:hypothetical protein